MIDTLKVMPEVRRHRVKRVYIVPQLFNRTKYVVNILNVFYLSIYKLCQGPRTNLDNR